jgi:type II secretory pathway predicted ATPase ExeA
MIDLRNAFGFHTTPFTREIRTNDFLSFPFFEEALDGLKRCIEARHSGALIAPAGTGKTSLLRRLTAALPEARYQVRYIKVTDLSKRDLCREIAVACGAQPAGAYSFLVRALQERFEHALHNEGLRPVILLDEAQDLRPDSFALIRHLTNFEMDSRLVLSLVLCGQPQLKVVLGRENQESVARRIHHYACLRLLSRDELSQYLQHRCNVAGAHQLPFDAGAVEALYELSRGNLRATDALALTALERDAMAKKIVVSTQHVAEARKELYP